LYEKMAQFIFTLARAIHARAGGTLGHERHGLFFIPQQRSAVHCGGALCFVLWQAATNQLYNYTRDAVRSGSQRSGFLDPDILALQVS
jgi:hypothetical protein